MSDEVNSPDHYNMHPSGVECITITRYMSFNIGNAIKYVWRCGLKPSANRIVDLQKAIWYLNDEIHRLKQEQENERQQELVFNQTQKDVAPSERTVECAACGYDIRTGAERGGHGVGCPLIS